MDLDEAADRLYGVAPEEFVATRTDLVRQARGAGDAPLAREIDRLRRPTLAAWAVNQVAREHPAELAELLDLGDRLRAAWHDHDAAALAELTARRSHLTGELVTLVRRTAERRGHPLAGGAATEIEQTLDAATVDAGAAAQVRSGRLVRSLSHTGFAPASPPRPRPEDEAGTRRRKARRTPGERGESTAKRPGDRARDGERAERERARARALAEAERALGEAERAGADHAEWAEELAAAQREHAELAGLAADLEARHAGARDGLARAERRLDVARRDERRAADAAASARRRADQARRALDRLAADPSEG